MMDRKESGAFALSKQSKEFTLLAVQSPKAIFFATIPDRGSTQSSELASML